MKHELTTNGSHNDGQDWIEQYERNTLKKGKLLRKVRDRAITIAQQNPFAFGVRFNKNDCKTGITATTEFSFPSSDMTTHFQLSLSVDIHKDGNVVNSIFLKEKGREWPDSGTIIYELDMGIGGDKVDDYQEITQAIDNNQVSREMKAFARAFYDLEEGIPAEISDNYAETKISTERMLSILNEAKGFEKPRDMSISLHDFQEEVKKRGEKIPKLLSKNGLPS